jgi:predicted molibdopterin-dependent oxidoreductase YjgC
MSPKAVDARRFVLDLLLSDHPLGLYHLRAERLGKCELQDLAYEYGVKETRYKGDATTTTPIDDANPLMVRDYNKCILCRRCMRACAEINGVEAIGLLERGFDTKVGTAFDGSLVDSPCEFCGMCIAVCPTGALTPKQAVGAGRAWEMEQVTTICPYCGVGCSLDLSVKDNQIVAADSVWEGPANHGATCVKGRFGWDYVESEERFTTPLIKKEWGVRRGELG